MAVAFYYGAKFDAKERCDAGQNLGICSNFFPAPPSAVAGRATLVPRVACFRADAHPPPRPRRERLFKRINSLPTVYEILSGKASAKAKANKKPPAGAVQVRERAASDPTLSPHAPARRFFPKRCLKSIRPTPSQAPAKKPALAPSARIFFPESR